MATKTTAADNTAEKAQAVEKTTATENAAEKANTTSETVKLIYIGPNLPKAMLQCNKIFEGTAEEIDKELANDPYNTELIERREELLGLQQDSILAAEDEKQAIVALVEEGIALELESLQNLIDTYTDALDSAKD